MTLKGHRVIRVLRDLLYDPKGHGDLCGRSNLFYVPLSSRGIRGRRDLFYDPKGHGDLFNRLDLVYDPKGLRVLEVAVTYFMTPKVTMTFMVGWTQFMTPKGHRVIRGNLDLLYYLKVPGDLCCRFDLVYDPLSSRGYKRSPWPTLRPKKSRWPFWLVWPSLWPQKVKGSSEVAMTYFITRKSMVTFAVGLT